MMTRLFKTFEILQAAFVSAVRTSETNWRKVPVSHRRASLPELLTSESKTSPKIPLDCFSVILRYCEQKTRVRCGECSKQLLQVVNEPSLWTSLTLVKRGYSKGNSGRVRTPSHAYTMDILNSVVVQPRYAHQHMIRLDLSYNYIGPFSCVLQLVSNKFPFLEYLNLTGCLPTSIWADKKEIVKASVAFSHIKEIVSARNEIVTCPHVGGVQKKTTNEGLT